MKYYKDKDGNIFAFDDKTTDIPDGLTQLTDEELDVLFHPENHMTDEEKVEWETQQKPDIPNALMKLAVKKYLNKTPEEFEAFLGTIKQNGASEEYNTDTQTYLTYMWRFAPTFSRTSRSITLIASVLGKSPADVNTFWDNASNIITLMEMPPELIPQ